MTDISTIVDLPGVIAKLNKARQMELYTISRYMQQHYFWTGTIADKIKEIAIAEMRHAEKLADRIIALGGTPVSGSMGGRLDLSRRNKTFEGNTQLEADTVNLYAEYGKLCNEYHKDYDTMTLFAEIIAEEQEHHTWFEFVSMQPAEL